MHRRTIVSLATTVLILAMAVAVTAQGRGFRGGAIFRAAPPGPAAPGPAAPDRHSSAVLRRLRSCPEFMPGHSDLRDFRARLLFRRSSDITRRMFGGTPVVCRAWVFPLYRTGLFRARVCFAGGFSAGRESEGD